MSKYEPLWEWVGNQPVESIEAIMDAARLRVRFCFYCLKNLLTMGTFLIIVELTNIS